MGLSVSVGAESDDGKSDASFALPFTAKRLDMSRALGAWCRLDREYDDVPVPGPPAHCCLSFVPLIASPEPLLAWSMSKLTRSPRAYVVRYTEPNYPAD